MSSKLSIWVVGAISAIGLSGPALAGGPMFRPGAVHIGSATPIRRVPPVAGIWHVRTGRTYFTGWGHVNTAYRVGTGTGYAWHGVPGAGVRFYGPSYGHTATQAGGLPLDRPGEHLATNGRPFGVWRRQYGLRDLPLGGSRYDGSRYRYGYRDWRYAPPYAAGQYGGFGGGYENGSSDYSGGYVEPSLGAQYAEGPLNQGYGPGGAPDSGGSDYAGGSYTPSIVGMGGPRILVVNNNAAACDCARRATPIVYRFGVGSYY